MNGNRGLFPIAHSIPWEKLNKWLRGRIAALRGARSLAYLLLDTSRSLRTKCLALHPACSFLQRFPWAVSAASLVFIILLTPQITMADQKQSNEALLSEIVSTTVRIMRRNGYEMPDYRVINGGTDVPISGPPEKYAFFGYLEKSWLQEKPTIVLHFYEANHLPLEGRKELINYLISLHAKQYGGFALSVRMMKEPYKKGQIVRPDAFLEMRLNRIEN